MELYKPLNAATPLVPGEGNFPQIPEVCFPKNKGDKGRKLIDNNE
jgi:hypothetical protein